jgi:DNA-3-methyladenine glycosylase II
MERITWELEPVAPFRLDLAVWTLRRRPDNIVDRWDGHTYRRMLVVDDQPVAVEVTQIGGIDTPRLCVTAVTHGAVPELEAEVTAALERLIGFRVDLRGWYRLAADDSRLGPLALRFRGTRPPRLPTLFETLVNAIACQQITLTLGIRLLNRLTEQYGMTHDTYESFAFPRPVDLVAADPADLRALGFSTAKARAIIELAQIMVEQRIDLEAIQAMEDHTAVARLQQLRGVGRWTAEYVLLRYLGRLHVFPGDDVGARNNLRIALGMPALSDYQSVRDALAPWRAYSGLVYFHLLLDRLAAGGYLDDSQLA